MLSRKLLAAATLATALAVAACGGEDDPVDPVVGPPDLTGSYTLESLTSVIVTGGATLSPPDVSGTFAVEQTTSSQTEATGTMRMDVLVPDGQGGTSEIVDQGTYVVRTDGTWEQSGTLVQARGTYTFANNVLTVVVTEPALSVSTTVWRRQ